ncbi:MAG TPA: extracellular solute-binding protein, partial [Chloroflexota bacterium]|nr:extracellular solute-binding protein [Chloroflexota bacterium]
MSLSQPATTRRSMLARLAGLAALPLLAACGGGTATTATTVATLSTAAPSTAAPSTAAPSTAVLTATVTSASSAGATSGAATTVAPSAQAASATSVAQSAAPAANGAVKLIWLDYNGGKQQQVFEQIIKQFSTANPGVGVEYNLVDGGQMATKAIAMVAGGTPPDLLTHDTGLFAAYAGKNLLRPLNDLIATAKWKPSDILPNV